MRRSFPRAYPRVSMRRLCCPASMALQRALALHAAPAEISQMPGAEDFLPAPMGPLGSNQALHTSLSQALGQGVALRGCYLQPRTPPCVTRQKRSFAISLTTVPRHLPTPKAGFGAIHKSLSPRALQATQASKNPSFGHPPLTGANLHSFRQGVLGTPYRNSPVNLIHTYCKPNRFTTQNYFQHLYVSTAYETFHAYKNGTGGNVGPSSNNPPVSWGGSLPLLLLDGWLPRVVTLDDPPFQNHRYPRRHRQV